jgi:hypothetical protein
MAFLFVISAILAVSKGQNGGYFHHYTGPTKARKCFSLGNTLPANALKKPLAGRT